MITRMSNHYGDDTCSAYAVAGGFIFLAIIREATNGQKSFLQMEESFKHLRSTLQAAGADLDDLVQINLYLKQIEHFSAARDVFRSYFDNEKFPVRMTNTTQFVNPSCLCMLDGIAYKPHPERSV
jgi:2-iminobutanoate/2-iminopropanoate deaminase